MLTIADLRAWYGKSQVLHGVNLQVGAGEIVALLGRNGAGRSTMLKAVMGGVVRTGSVRFGDTEIVHLPPHKVARLGLGYVAEDRSIFPDLTTQQNLILGEKPGPASKNAGGPFAISDAYALFPRLRERAGAPAGALSGGEQQMLAIARALMSRPRLLLLDEPSLGLAPIIVLEIFSIIRELNTQGVTMLLVEQNARLAMQNSNRTYVMEAGQVTFSGPSEQMVSDERVLHAYLGG